MPGAKIIHLATHGVIDSSNPLSSFLALGRTTDQPGGNGRLTAEEVYSLDLHADLVVLWDVAEQPTAELLASFYRSFNKPNASKSQALRQAQLRNLQSLRTGQISTNTPFGRLVLPEAPILGVCPDG